MGKHDKKEEQATRFSWQPMPDEFYKERIKTLEKRVKELEDELKATKAELAFNTGYMESCAESAQRSLGCKDDVIKRKDEEIAMCKEAIFLAAMREVELR